MAHRALRASLPFVSGLAIGWLISTVLLAADVVEPYAIGAGWLAFFLVTAALLQRRHVMH